MVGTAQYAPLVEPWRRRLYLPAYRVGAAARYAQTTRQTVTRWHHGTEAGAAGMPERAPREALSYFQLIEVAVVAAFRREGVSLKAIRTARDYAAQQFECEFPFAQLEFARAGRELLLNLEDISRGDEEEQSSRASGASERGKSFFRSLSTKRETWSCSGTSAGRLLRF